MSYMTSFSLTVEDLETRKSIGEVMAEKELNDLANEIEKMDVFSDGDLRYDELHTYTTWYSYTEDMCLLSSKYPNLLFVLNGVGEDPADLWKAYYVDGKEQMAPGVITFAEFDQGQLVPPKNPRTKYSYS